MENPEKEKRKRGGQPGNKNALKHGAYMRIHLDMLPPEDRAYVETVTLDVQENMLREYQLLVAKEMDLLRRIAGLDAEHEDTMYTDRVMEVFRPEDGDESDTEPALALSMKTVSKSSAFNRRMKLESQLDCVRGRMIKLIDNMKGYEMEARRLEIEQKRYELARQKATGEFEIQPEIDGEDIGRR